MATRHRIAAPAIPGCHPGTRAGSVRPRGARVLWLLAVALSAILSCANPFFPPMGLPQKSSGRGTPEGVIKQFMRSYTTRSLTLFEDLFAQDGGFRYYVPQEIMAKFGKLEPLSKVERIDRRYAFVDSGGIYEYIAYADEVMIHRKMFEECDEIAFSPSLTIDSVYYHRALVRIDSALVNDNDSGSQGPRTVRDSIFDTTAVEVRTADVTIRITAEFLGTGINGYVPYEVEQQDFLLARDPEDPGLWVIDKWFEL